jgi:hypothetical protein
VCARMGDRQLVPGRKQMGDRGLPDRAGSTDEDDAHPPSISVSVPRWPTRMTS